MGNGTIAASIIVGHSTAAALLTFGTACGAGPAMNACWIAAVVCLYAPIVWAMRACKRSRS